MHPLLAMKVNGEVLSVGCESLGSLLFTRDTSGPHCASLLCKEKEREPSLALKNAINSNVIQRVAVVHWKEQEVKDTRPVVIESLLHRIAACAFVCERVNFVAQLENRIKETRVTRRVRTHLLHC